MKTLSCRQCVHATPELDGDARWSCAKHNTDRTFDEQCNPCNDLLLIPSLIDWASPIDSVQNEAGQDAIVFESEDGSTWQHGPDAHCNQYSAGDLITMPRSLIGCTGMTAVKKQLGGSVSRVVPDIAHRYQRAEVLWTGPRDEIKTQLVAHGIGASKPTVTANCDEWNAAEWHRQGGDVAAFIYPDGRAEIKQQIVVD